MKERFARFKSGLGSFLKREMKTGLMYIWYITPFGVCSGLGIRSFTLVAIYKKSDTIAIYSCHSLQKEWKERIILLKRAKERFVLFCQKKSDLHEKPKSEFPTLQVKLDSCGMKRDISPLHSIRYSSWFPLMAPLFPQSAEEFSPIMEPSHAKPGIRAIITSAVWALSSSLNCLSYFPSSFYKRAEIIGYSMYVYCR